MYPGTQTRRGFAGNSQLSTVQGFVNLPALDRFDGLLGVLDLHLDVLSRDSLATILFGELR